MRMAVQALRAWAQRAGAAAQQPNSRAALRQRLRRCGHKHACALFVCACACRVCVRAYP